MVAKLVFPSSGRASKSLGLVLSPAPVYFLSDAKIALSWLELAKKRLFFQRCQGGRPAAYE